MNRDPRFALSQEVEAKQTLLDQLRALAADDPDFFTDLTEQKPDRGLGSQNPTGYEVGRERILSHKSEFPATGICKLTSPPSYEVFGCRPSIDHCCRRAGD